MGPGYFVIAILGCADGGSACTPVATLPTHYATADAMLRGDARRRSKRTAISISRPCSRAAAPRSSARRPRRGAHRRRSAAHRPGHAAAAERATEPRVGGAGFQSGMKTRRNPNPSCRAGAGGKPASDDDEPNQATAEEFEREGMGVAPRSKPGVSMSDVMEPMIHEDQLPGHESKLEPKPDWEPRYPGSGPAEGQGRADHRRRQRHRPRRRGAVRPRRRRRRDPLPVRA